jgi:GntR family transcriptional regulator/MocR family aminotransferase
MWALREAGRTAPTAVMGDEADAGSLRLREVVAAYHRRVRAGTAEAEHAVIVNGFRHGLVLALGALARSGVEQVALEDPGPRHHDEIVRRAGMQPVSVPVDSAGLDVDALRRSTARAALVTPAHQCPSGVVMAPERRHALVAWAADVDGIVLEDDYDAELPALDQPALATLMQSGRYDRHVRRMSEVYRQRRDALVGAVAAHAPRLRLLGLEAGCHAVLELPAGVTEDEIVQSALSHAVRVYGLSRYRVDAPRAAETHVPPALVLGFGNLDEERIRRGVEALGEAITQALSGMAGQGDQ